MKHDHIKTMGNGLGLKVVRPACIGVFIFLVFVTPLFSQEVEDAVVEAGEAIARSAGRLLPAALDLTPGSEDVSFAVGRISVDGHQPRIAELLSALVTDELFARASALRARRGIEVISAGSPGVEPDLAVTIIGTIGDAEVLFVVQIVDQASGVIRAGARVGVQLTQPVRAAFSPSVPSTALHGGSAGGDPDDVSDDPQYAPRVDLDTSLSNQRLSVGGDHDWFQILIPDVSFDVDDGIPMLAVYTTGSTDTYIEVYGPDDYEILQSENDDGGEGTNARVLLSVENDGAYWVLVRGFSDSSAGTYDLHIETSVVEVDAFEPNDSIDSAAPLGFSDGEFASIRPSGDVDWYAIDIEEYAASSDQAGEVFLAIETFGEIDTVMSAYDRHGNELAYNDDGGEGGNARVLVSLGANGPVYVEVGGFGDWVDGEYEISTTLVELIVDEYEPDDTQAEAQEIEIGDDAQLRNFSTKSDIDWAVFEVDEERYPTGVAVRTYTDGNIDTYIVLYDQFGSELFGNDDDGFGYNAMIERRLAPGRYYIEVYPLYLDGMNGEYTLTVEEVR